MKDIIKNNWINGLGISFLFTAFLYFLKLVADNGWLPPEARAASGLILGTSSLFAGFLFYKKKRGYLAETIAGLGVAIIYATLAYISFNRELLWSHNALLISMVTITLISSLLAVRQDMRVLYILSTIGGLISPLVLKATYEQDLMLFIYLLILNVAALYVSAVKKWDELKIISFISTLAIYTSYYVLFDPIQWQKPFFYISSFFAVYTVGLLINSWNQKCDELGIDQYLELVNAINFVFWSTFIFGEFDIPHTIPMIIVGAVFLGIGSLMFYTKGKELTLYTGSYLLLGVIVMAISCSDTGMLLTGGMNYVINSGIWLALISTAFVFGKQMKNENILYGTYAAFVLLSAYWYSVAWDVEWVSVLGIKYIPFLNAGAMIWIGLLSLGYVFSTYESKNQTESQIERKYLSIGLGLLSHIIVGGLLTVQISNLWEAYDIRSFSLGLATSISWIVYALIIYLWSKFNTHKVYRFFGAAILILTSIKVFAWDLYGSATIQKVIFLLAIGGITLVIGRINNTTKIKEA